VRGIDTERFIGIGVGHVPDMNQIMDSGTSLAALPAPPALSFRMVGPINEAVLPAALGARGFIFPSVGRCFTFWINVVFFQQIQQTHALFFLVVYGRVGLCRVLCRFDLGRCDHNQLNLFILLILLYICVWYVWL
jgi:hypothetical protein